MPVQVLLLLTVGMRAFSTLGQKESIVAQLQVVILMSSDFPGPGCCLFKNSFTCGYAGQVHVFHDQGTGRWFTPAQFWKAGAQGRGVNNHRWLGFSIFHLLLPRNPQGGLQLDQLAGSKSRYHRHIPPQKRTPNKVKVRYVDFSVDYYFVDTELALTLDSDGTSKNQTN